MDALTAWLQKLGLERYTQVFAENEVDLEALRVLGEQDFEKLGVPLGPRKKLLRAIAKLNRAKASAAKLQTVTDHIRVARAPWNSPVLITSESGGRCRSGARVRSKRVELRSPEELDNTFAAVTRNHGSGLPMRR